MKPSERIMVIYSRNMKSHINEEQMPLAMLSNFADLSNKIYCDSIVEYLDEVHNENS